jgi:hypothetical protein
VAHFLQPTCEGPPAESTQGTQAATSFELNCLKDALLSIDGATRTSVLALMRSMAESAVAKRRRPRTA